MADKSDEPKIVAGDVATELPVCGLVRPIASAGDYSVQHWADVHDILSDAATQAGYRLALVSETDVSGTILGDIVSNLYNNEIVICDVSGRNPNVMFELGMRLAFEKPVVIVVDDETPFSFDISPIRHLVYPRALRYADIVDFKKKVAAALHGVREGKFSSGPGYLQQFGPIKVTKIEGSQVDVGEVAEQVAQLTRAVSSLLSNANSGMLFPKNAREHPAENSIGGIVLNDATVEVDQAKASRISRMIAGHERCGPVITEMASGASRAVIRFNLRNISSDGLLELITRIKAVDQSAVFGKDVDGHWG